MNTQVVDFPVRKNKVTMSKRNKKYYQNTNFERFQKSLLG